MWASANADYGVAQRLWLPASEHVHCENVFDRLNDQLRVERTHLVVRATAQ
jgi:hypothetical protein